MSAMSQQPAGAGFDVVLLLHVAFSAVGLVTAVSAAATASRLRRLVGSGRPVPEALQRYFRPGVNWAGRAVYGIPVFGFALVGMSGGAYALTDGWVLAGLVLFAAVAALGELVMWPAERRLQTAVGAGAVGEALGTETLGADARTMARAAGAMVALLAAAVMLMTAQP
jgi:uncharacterized membrane protein